MKNLVQSSDGVNGASATFGHSISRRATFGIAGGALAAAMMGPLAAQEANDLLTAADPAFWDLVEPGTRVNVLAQGMDMGRVPAGVADDYGASLESPLWIASRGYLLFSDIPQNRILKWEPRGGVSVFLQPSGHANGLWLDPQGRLLMAEHGGRQVSRLELDGSRTVIMRSYRSQRLHRPNTVIVRSDGGIYFTDFGFRASAVEDWDLDHEGIYYVSPDLGTRRLLEQNLVRPHKILFTNDERTLLVGQDEGILAYDVTDIAMPDPSQNYSGGSIRGRRWFWRRDDPEQPPLSRQVGVDGMKMDVNGNVWVASGRNGVAIISAAGKVLGNINTTRLGTGSPNLCFGGPDMKTVFVVTNHLLLSFRSKVAGQPIPSMPHDGEAHRA